MSALPFLGLGLSSNANPNDSPHPYALLQREPGIFDYVEYSAPLRFGPEAKALRERGVPMLFHPVHLNLWGPEVESAERLAELDAHARAVGSAWVGNDVAWWHVGGCEFPGYLYLAPPLDEAALGECVEHASVVARALSVPLALENPVVMTPRGSMHVLEFMARLSERTRCPLILDVGHLYAHQLARGLPLFDGLGDFPFERVIELHIAGGAVDGALYVDDHRQPIVGEVWQLLEHVLPRCSELRALTYEGDGHSDDDALQTLHRLQKGWARR